MVRSFGSIRAGCRAELTFFMPDQLFLPNDLVHATNSFVKELQIDTQTYVIEVEEFQSEVRCGHRENQVLEEAS